MVPLHPIVILRTRSFYSTCCHHRDLSIKAEWHFWPTSHGKGPCVGVGGTVKRQEREASLRASTPDPQINSAQQLFDWTKIGKPGVLLCIYGRLWKEWKISSREVHWSGNNIWHSTLPLIHPQWWELHFCKRIFWPINQRRDLRNESDANKQKEQN